jgi:hypothetical protein
VLDFALVCVRTPNPTYTLAPYHPEGALSATKRPVLNNYPAQDISFDFLWIGYKINSRTRY